MPSGSTHPGGGGWGEWVGEYDRAKGKRVYATGSTRLERAGQTAASEGTAGGTARGIRYGAGRVSGSGLRRWERNDSQVVDAVAAVLHPSHCHGNPSQRRITRLQIRSLFPCSSRAPVGGSPHQLLCAGGHLDLEVLRPVRDEVHQRLIRIAGRQPDERVAGPHLGAPSPLPADAEAPSRRRLAPAEDPGLEVAQAAPNPRGAHSACGSWLVRVSLAPWLGCRRREKACASFCVDLSALGFAQSEEEIKKERLTPVGALHPRSTLPSTTRHPTPCRPAEHSLRVPHQKEQHSHSIDACNNL
eukprot:scaffold3061_cov106-Isochrysis_galbana.AAC.2